MMQQTETYKLNKPESTDTFSVGPLNENADKIETALAALDGTAADHETRIMALELKKVVVGSYMGTGAAQLISLGFYPIAVIVCGYGDTRIATRELWNNSVEVVEDGFWARNIGTAQFNMSANRYHYIAFG